MTSTANGTLDVTVQPRAAELDGAIGRFELSKTFHGDLQGTGTGVMLSVGDPQAGAAGYVAIETVRGRLCEQEGTFALQQFGSMHDGSQTLHYEGRPWLRDRPAHRDYRGLHLDVDEDGTHHYELLYDL